MNPTEQRIEKYKMDQKDPTTNVHSLISLVVQRQDDLRDAEARRVNEQMILRAEYAVQLNVAEAKRIDAIRAVDVNAVSVANERATAQAAVLANQVAASAETLRALVAATAATQAQQLAQLTNQLTDRLASLEKSQYENSGRAGNIQPQVSERLATLEGVKSENAGRSGITQQIMMALAAAVVGLIVFLVEHH